MTLFFNGPRRSLRRVVAKSCWETRKVVLFRVISSWRILFDKVKPLLYNISNYTVLFRGCQYLCYFTFCRSNKIIPFTYCLRGGGRFIPSCYFIYSIPCVEVDERSENYGKSDRLCYVGRTLGFAGICVYSRP
jgi:hypothetical protein